MKRIPRRTFLKGAGAMISLPLLEAMLPSRYAYAAAANVRFLAMYFPIGIVATKMSTHRMDAWRPSAAGNLSSLNVPIILDPLKNFRGDYSIVNGLRLNRTAQGGDGEHAAAAAMFLTCKQPPDFRNSDRQSDSVDQVLGRYLQAQGGHSFSSLVTSPNRKTGMDGFTPTHWVPGFTGNISYFNNTRVGKYSNPLQLFDLLFPSNGMGNADAAARALLHKQKKSILDAVTADANALKARLGAADKTQLEQYFDGIREAERKIASLVDNQPTEPTYTRPGNEVHQANDDYSHTNSNYGLRVRTFIDLIVLAMQVRKTPAATLMLDSENSTDETGDTRIFANCPDFPDYDGVTRAQMTTRYHDLSHSGDLKQRLAVNRYHTGFFAYLINKLKTTSDTNGSLFDSSMAVYGCGICDSTEHEHFDLPILLAGKGGGLNPGRNIMASNNPTNLAANLPLANLYLALMQKAGMTNSSFADSTGALGNL